MSFNLAQVLKELGITEDFIEASQMPPCEECTDLVDAGLDLFDRPQQMTLRTFEAWCEMKTAAKSDGLELNLVSAIPLHRIPVRAYSPETGRRQVN